MAYGKVLAFSILATVLLCCAPMGSAQIAVDIGVAPVCPYGYFDYAPYDCAPYGYYGPDWFVGGIFLEPALGPTAHTASTGTSITASILITDNMARCRGAERRNSTTSTATRRGMDKAT